MCEVVGSVLGLMIFVMIKKGNGEMWKVFMYILPRSLHVRKALPLTACFKII
jgi:hypothetical protein